MSAAVELRAVSKVYGAGDARVQALNEIDLEVAAGELIAVAGWILAAREPRLLARTRLE